MNLENPPRVQFFAAPIPVNHLGHTWKMSHLGQQKSKTSVEKGEVEVIEEEGAPSLSKLEFSTENKEYLRLLSYQEENAGRLVFDPQ